MAQTENDRDGIQKQAELLNLDKAGAEKRRSFLLQLQLRVLFGLEDLSEELIVSLNDAININYLACMSNDMRDLQQNADNVTQLFIIKLGLHHAAESEKIQVITSVDNDSNASVKAPSFFLKPKVKSGAIAAISAFVLGTCIYAILSVSISALGMAILIIAAEMAFCFLLYALYPSQNQHLSI